MAEKTNRGKKAAAPKTAGAAPAAPSVPAAGRPALTEAELSEKLSAKLLHNFSVQP